MISQHSSNDHKIKKLKNPLYLKLQMMRHPVPEDESLHQAQNALCFRRRTHIK